MKLSLVIFTIAFSINFSHAQFNGWYEVPGAPVSGRFEDITFINDSVGWIGQNDTIFKTTDKGNTWTALYSSTLGPLQYVRSLEFINDTLGFAGCLYNFNGNYFYVTKDGGLTWTPIDSLLPVPIQGICGMDSRDGMVVAAGSVNNLSQVFISHDYGATWTFHDLSSLSAMLIDCHILDSLQLLITGTSTQATGLSANICRSVDGGNTWTEVAQSAYPSTFGWKIFMQDNGIGAVSIESFTDGLFFKTLDSGLTWQEYPLSGSSVINIGGIAVINDTLLFTGDQHGPGMASSMDGGLSWQNMNFGQALDRIHVFDDHTAIGVGITVYKYHPDSIVTSVTGFKRPRHTFELRSSDQIHFTLYADLYQKAKLMVELFSSEGKYLAQPLNEFYEKGKHSFQMETQHLPSGNYFYRIRTFEYLTGIQFIKK